MKLFDVPPKSYVRVVEDTVRIPSAALGIEPGETIFFDHLDGMYSYCTNEKGQLVHLAAWTKVEIVEEGGI